MHNLKHLSTSKDNTPTPRTDAAVADGWSGDAFLVPYKFAQGLERENEELREQLSDWLKANGPGGWIDGLRKHNTHETGDQLQLVSIAHAARCYVEAREKNQPTYAEYDALFHAVRPAQKALEPLQAEIRAATSRDCSSTEDAGRPEPSKSE